MFNNLQISILIKIKTYFSNSKEINKKVVDLKNQTPKRAVKPNKIAGVKTMSNKLVIMINVKIVSILTDK